MPIYLKGLYNISMGHDYNENQLKIAVIIPAYKVSQHIQSLLERIDQGISDIYVVDDKCPEKSGEIALRQSKIDTRIKVIFHGSNLGVGGAVKTGYREALKDGSDIMIKLDGDGQMRPEDIQKLVDPILRGNADYAKGNRFYNVEAITEMPKVRIFGNLILSFMSKLSTGYWMIFDPNNGFTAITKDALGKLSLEKIDNRYFFESDMLFRLNLCRVGVADVELPAIYGDEVSNLKVKRVLIEFPIKHLRNYFKRIAYSYFLREFTLASLELILGILLLLFGLTYGSINYLHSAINQVATPTGTLIIVAMSVLSGLQFILSFFAYDIHISPDSRRP